VRSSSSAPSQTLRSPPVSFILYVQRAGVLFVVSRYILRKTRSMLTPMHTDMRERGRDPKPGRENPQNLIYTSPGKPGLGCLKQPPTSTRLAPPSTPVRGSGPNIHSALKLANFLVTRGLLGEATYPGMSHRPSERKTRKACLGRRGLPWAVGTEDAPPPSVCRMSGIRRWVADPLVIDGSLPSKG
jgi:hypothetical protein